MKGAAEEEGLHSPPSATSALSEASDVSKPPASGSYFNDDATFELFLERLKSATGNRLELPNGLADLAGEAPLQPPQASLTSAENTVREAQNEGNEERAVNEGNGGSGVKALKLSDLREEVDANENEKDEGEESLDSDGDDQLTEPTLRFVAPHLSSRAPQATTPITEGDAYFFIPDDLYALLLPHQKTGLRFLLGLYRNGLGGILADEMGLGKTVQIIAFLSVLLFSKALRLPRPSRPARPLLPDCGALQPDLESEGIGRLERLARLAWDIEYSEILIVTPATLMDQWAAEIRRFAPYFRVVNLHSAGTLLHQLSARLQGNGLREPETISDLFKSKNLETFKEKPPGYAGAIYMTSYESVRDHYARVFRHLKWGLIVLDEGHKIRNCEAQITQTAKQLRGSLRYLLSGTPIQNSLTDLWSLVDFTSPGHLGSYPVFVEHFARPIAVSSGKTQTRSSQARGLGLNRGVGPSNGPLSHERRRGTEVAKILRVLLAPIMLRRSKKQVNFFDQADLQKSEEVVLCPLTETQHLLYTKFLQTSDVQRQLSKSLARSHLPSFRSSIGSTGDGFTSREVNPSHARLLGDAADDIHGSHSNPAAPGTATRGKEGLRCLFYISVLLKVCNHADLLITSHSDVEKDLYLSLRRLPPVGIGDAEKDSGIDRDTGRAEGGGEGEGEGEGDDQGGGGGERGRTCSDYGSPARSAKLALLIALVRRWKEEGRQFLVFSRSLRTLDIIDAQLKARFEIEEMDAREGKNESAQTLLGRIDGRVSLPQRAAAVRKFNEGSIRGLLLTTRVGGIGLNLTAASRVCLFDPDWNPAQDEQAQERVWRIGQNQNVRVYRLLTKGTIEEKIYKRQIYKSILTKKVLAEDKKWLRAAVVQNDFLELFNFPPPPHSQLQPTVECKTKTENGATLDTHGRDDTRGPDDTADVCNPHINVKKRRKWFEDGELSDASESDLPTQEGQVKNGKLRAAEVIVSGQTSVVDSEEEESESDENSKREGKGVDAEANSFVDNFFGESEGNVFNHADALENCRSLVSAPDPHDFAKHGLSALAAVRESQRLRKNYGAHMLTWTGKSGRVGRPEENGLSPEDNDLVQRLSRKFPTATEKAKSDSQRKIVSELVRLMHGKKAPVTTAELLSKFSGRDLTPTQKLVFKDCLNVLCDKKIEQRSSRSSVPSRGGLGIRASREWRPLEKIRDKKGDVRTLWSLKKEVRTMIDESARKPSRGPRTDRRGDLVCREDNDFHDSLASETEFKKEPKDDVADSENEDGWF